LIAFLIPSKNDFALDAIQPKKPPEDSFFAS
jgi:hypothetical protein